ncbi:tRNA 2-thiouridine(34) synthase MnmA [Patescibacteria group bacterium]|nr:tRNA 2-thiouridine(34) synthase MnmA [Patescibacteria group bacterium]
MKKKVIVAMSGGVDSSVAAALLKQKGYDVVAVFMKFWKESKSINRCCSLESQTDARTIAKKLNIPFYIIDVRKEFKKRVVDYFISEYEKGKTPNPCIECNKFIKFNVLIKKALELKADFIATGHYARIKNNSLYIAKDKSKDQSYFLWVLKDLNKILFPIGDYDKKEIRSLAKKFNLPVFEKKDSQEVCFINNSVEEFLNKRIKFKKGDIIFNKKVIGKHNGLHFYTIGQRKGIGIGGIGPFYVASKDFKKNELIVIKSDSDDSLFKKELKFSKSNWFINVKFPLKCKAKIRYLSKSVDCVVNKDKVIFLKKQKAVTSGQSIVFYSNGRVLGGGVIM